VRRTDQCHDVPDIDRGFRGKRDLLSSAREIAKKNAARGIADPIGDFAQRAAVQLIIGDEDAKRVARSLPQHLSAFDLWADRSTGLDEGRCWSGENDLIPAFEDRLPFRFDVAAVADNASEDDTMADAVFDCADRLPGGGGDDPIGPRLEFLVT
jgi:hypothetical protein